MSDEKRVKILSMDFYLEERKDENVRFGVVVERSGAFIDENEWLALSAHAEPPAKSVLYGIADIFRQRRGLGALKE